MKCQRCYSREQHASRQQDIKQDRYLLSARGRALRRSIEQWSFPSYGRNALRVHHSSHPNGFCKNLHVECSDNILIEPVRKDDTSSLLCICRNKNNVKDEVESALNSNKNIHDNESYILTKLKQDEDNISIDNVELCPVHNKQRAREPHFFKLPHSCGQRQSYRHVDDIRGGQAEQYDFANVGIVIEEGVVEESLRLRIEKLFSTSTAEEKLVEMHSNESKEIGDPDNEYSESPNLDSDSHNAVASDSDFGEGETDKDIIIQQQIRDVDGGIRRKLNPYSSFVRKSDLGVSTSVPINDPLGESIGKSLGSGIATLGEAGDSDWLISSSSSSEQEDGDSQEDEEQSDLHKSSSFESGSYIEGTSTGSETTEVLTKSKRNIMKDAVRLQNVSNKMVESQRGSRIMFEKTEEKSEVEGEIDEAQNKDNLKKHFKKSTKKIKKSARKLFKISRKNPLKIEEEKPITKDSLKANLEELENTTVLKLFKEYLAEKTDDLNKLESDFIFSIT